MITADAAGLDVRAEPVAVDQFKLKTEPQIENTRAEFHVGGRVCRGRREVGVRVVAQALGRKIAQAEREVELGAEATLNGSGGENSTVDFKIVRGHLHAEVGEAGADRALKAELAGGGQRGQFGRLPMSRTAKSEGGAEEEGAKEGCGDVDAFAYGHVRFIGAASDEIEAGRVEFGGARREGMVAVRFFRITKVEG